jgi:hypothetical protein
MVGTQASAVARWQRCGSTRLKAQHHGQGPIFPLGSKAGFHSKVKGVEGSPCVSGRGSRTVVTGSTKGEAERSRKQNRDGVEVFGWSGSLAVRSVASQRSPPRSSSGAKQTATTRHTPFAQGRQIGTARQDRWLTYSLLPLLWRFDEHAVSEVSGSRVEVEDRQ